MPIIRSLTLITGLTCGLSLVALAQDSAFTRHTAQGLLRDVRRITTPNGIEQLTPVQIGGVRQ